MGPEHIEINRVKEFRINRNKTQKWLAEKTGLSQATISNIENFYTNAMPLSKRRISWAFNIDVYKLFPAENKLPIRCPKCGHKFEKQVWL